MKNITSTQTMYIRALYPQSDITLSIVDGRVAFSGTINHHDACHNSVHMQTVADMAELQLGELTPLSIDTLLEGPDAWDREYEYYYDTTTSHKIPYDTFMRVCEGLAQSLKLRSCFLTAGMLQHKEDHHA